MTQWRLLCFSVLSLWLAGCQLQSADSQSPESAESPSVVLRSCELPRPQMCTRQYDPVCARHVDGHYSTKSNVCTACSDVSVIEVYAHECTKLSR